MVARSPSLRILLADDDPALCEALPGLLGLHLPDAQVNTVQSMAAALEELTKRDYDVVFCDLALPDGSGASLAWRIRELRPDTIVMLISGHLRIRAYHVATRSFGYLQKPFERQYLISTLKRLQRFCRLKRRLQRRGRAVEEQLRIVRSYQARLNLTLRLVTYRS